MRPDVADCVVVYSLYNSGKYEKAIQDYSKAIKLNPQGAKAYYNRGVAILIAKLWSIILNESKRVLLESGA